MRYAKKGTFRYKIFETWEEVIATDLNAESEELLMILDKQEYDDMKKYGSRGDYVPKSFVEEAENEARRLEKENFKLRREINNLKLELEKYNEADPYKDRVKKYQNYIDTLEIIKKEKNRKIENLENEKIDLKNKISTMKMNENEEILKEKLNNAYDIIGRWKEKYEKLKSQKIRNYKKTKSATENEFNRGKDGFQGVQNYDLRDIKMRKKHYIGKENIVLPIPNTLPVEAVKEYIFNGENEMINEIILHNSKYGYCDIIGVKTNLYYEMWEIIIGKIDKK